MLAPLGLHKQVQSQETDDRDVIDRDRRNTIGRNRRETCNEKQDLRKVG